MLRWHCKTSIHHCQPPEVKQALKGANDQTIKLNDGNCIPNRPIGLWQNKDKSEFDAAFTAAIKAGYTHFDSAQAYDNEQFLGEAMQNQKREDLFVTTKIGGGTFWLQ